jgi:ABC-type nitrate/sulfonate/bicarbonate transport system ATPase subunit
VVSLEHVGKSFEDMVVFKDITLHVEHGEVVSLLGSSGSGKSTLFNIIAGLYGVDHGRVEVKGTVGYMQQKDLLLPWKTVYENIALPLKLHHASKEEIRMKVDKYLPMAGLAGTENKYPYQLSGGMRQRVSFVRTLMRAEDIMLFDEAFGSLDYVTRRQMQHWLLEMKQNLDNTMIFITHDIDEAIYLSDRIYVLSKIPARIEKEIDVDFLRENKDQRFLDPRTLALKEEILSLM